MNYEGIVRMAKRGENRQRRRLMRRIRKSCRSAARRGYSGIAEHTFTSPLTAKEVTELLSKELDERFEFVVRDYSNRSVSISIGWG